MQDQEKLRADVARMTSPPGDHVPPSQSTTFGAAVHDLTRGFSQHQLWLQLGWQDIKQRYRRSVLGPLWITIATGVMALALGLLYSVLFKVPIDVFLPHVTVGLIMWGFISGCIREGADIFIDNEGLIKQLPAAISIHAYRLVWKQSLFLAHNLVIWVVLMVIFPRNLSWNVLLMVPAMALLIINGVWVVLFFGIIATRYRDVSPLLEAGVQLLFYVTPIVWMTSTLNNNIRDMGGRAHLALLNPLYHYLEIVRAPMIGQPISGLSWIVVGGCTVVGLVLALLAMKQWRFRVSYWV